MHQQKISDYNIDNLLRSICGKFKTSSKKKDYSVAIPMGAICHVKAS